MTWRADGTISGPVIDTVFVNGFSFNLSVDVIYS